MRLIKILQGVKQLSWAYDQTYKRYPAPEALTKSEIEQLQRIYFALGYDLESLSKEWKTLSKEYKDEQGD